MSGKKEKNQLISQADVMKILYACNYMSNLPGGLRTWQIAFFIRIICRK